MSAGCKTIREWRWGQLDISDMVRTNKGFNNWFCSAPHDQECRRLCGRTRAGARLLWGPVVSAPSWHCRPRMQRWMLQMCESHARRLLSGASARACNSRCGIAVCTSWCIPCAVRMPIGVRALAFGVNVHGQYRRGSRSSAPRRRRPHNGALTRCLEMQPCGPARAADDYVAGALGTSS